MSGPGTQSAQSALADLIAARDVFLAELSDLEATSVEDQIELAQEFERFRHSWMAVDLRIMAALDVSDAAATLCQGNLRRVLTSCLSISKAEAARRVHAYEQLGPRRTMLGEELRPIRPVVAESVAAGEVSAEKAAIITRGLARVDRVGFDPADIAAGEKLLVDDAKVFNPEELKLLTQRVVDLLDPDGSVPDEQLQRDRRFLEIRSVADGGYAGQFRLTATCGTKLMALLGPLSKSRVDDPCASDEITTVGARAKLIDERTFGQRQHDALEECCDRLLREGAVRENNAPVSIIVTVDEADLARRTGHAVTTTGGLISTPTLLDMAGQADVYPTVLSTDGVPLKLGRSRRLASRRQTIALIARDVGCSFPGCAHSAEYCERHHVVPWIDGGATDLDNLTLLCVYHHHNFLSRGWTVRINERGLPEWLPPRWVDPERKPMINRRIRAAHRRLTSDGGLQEDPAARGG